MIYYKVNIMEELKNAGFSSTYLRNKKILPESTMQKFRNGDPVNMETINKVCILLQRNPEDLIGVKITPEEKEKYFDLLYRKKTETAKPDHPEKG